MNAKELKEHARLSTKWAVGKATMKEMLRCMELDAKAARRNRESRQENAVRVRVGWLMRQQLAGAARADIPEAVAWRVKDTAVGSVLIQTWNGSTE